MDSSQPSAAAAAGVRVCNECLETCALAAAAARRARSTELTADGAAAATTATAAAGTSERRQGSCFKVVPPALCLRDGWGEEAEEGEADGGGAAEDRGQRGRKDAD